MKIAAVDGKKESQDGTLTLLITDHEGVKHALEFSPESLEKLFLAAITGKSYDPRGIPLLRFRPRTLRRFLIGDQRGLSFLFDGFHGIHLMFSKEAAGQLQGFLETFDDPSTWDTKGPTRQ